MNTCSAHRRHRRKPPRSQTRIRLVVAPTIFAEHNETEELEETQELEEANATRPTRPLSHHRTRTSKGISEESTCGEWRCRWSAQRRVALATRPPQQRPSTRPCPPSESGSHRGACQLDLRHRDHCRRREDRARRRSTNTDNLEPKWLTTLHSKEGLLCLS